MKSEFKTVSAYMAAVPDDRREQIARVREVILQNLPTGYEEVINWGMITYQVPLKRFPNTYNKQPLMYAALASQKNHMAVYLTNVYGVPKLSRWFEEEYKKSGKRLDMGKSCVRFRKIDDLPLELIGKTIAKSSVEDVIEYYEDARKSRKTKI